MTQKLPENLIERAAELWARKLRAPSFDNGDKSETGFFGMALAGINADSDINKVADYDKAVDNFKAILIRNIKAADADPDQYVDPFLTTDYNPGGTLADAAEEAGIPLSAFSIKSTVYIASDYVSSSFGYGAPQTYHYPLSSGGWLVCSLNGPEIDKIIEYVETGKLPEFTTEAA